MDRYYRDSVAALNALRNQFNGQVEQEFIRQLYPQIVDWADRIPWENFKDIFRQLQLRREEIDLLLREDAKSGLPQCPLIACASQTNYKDEPDLDEDGRPPQRRTTPLHMIAGLEFPEILPYVAHDLFDIYDRFDVNYTDELGFTHFHAACKCNVVKAVTKFLELGQDPNLIVPGTLDSPLHLTTSPEVVELLLEKGSDPTLTNAKRSTPLHSMCRGGLMHTSQELTKKFFEINEKIGQHRVPINAQDNSGNAPLHLALMACQRGTMEILLNNGADPNLPHGKNLWTPLHFICLKIMFATHNQKIPMVELLLRAGADPNATLEGSTPLHLICQHHDHHVELLKKIFELGGRRVNVNAEDRQGRTPLFYAVVTLGPSLVDVLLDNGADLTSFNFPTYDDFREYSKKWNHGAHDILILASGVLAIVDILQKGGYKWYEREEIYDLTIGELFEKFWMFQPLSDSDIRLRRGKCWFEEDAFVEKAKEIKFKGDLSLHEVIQLRPKEAKKKLDYLDYFRFATSGDLHKLGNYKYGCALHLCEKLARAHFLELALEVFPSVIPIGNSEKHYQEVNETICDHLRNKDLWHMYKARQQQIEIDRKKNNGCKNNPKLKALRKQFNRQVEDEFIRQLYLQTLDWKDRISWENFKDIFLQQLRREEIDLLLREDATRGHPLCPLIACASKTNYKDEPDLDEDGKPPQRRTTPLHMIARLESYEISTCRVRDLFNIYDRFDVNYTDELGFTHFHAACKYGLDGVAKKFLEFGQDPNLIVPGTLDSPLHLTTSPEVVKLLLEKGADPTLTNAKGSTPLHNMCRLTKNSKALTEKFFEINEKIGQHRVPINAQDESGNAPLHLALMASQVGTMEILLNNGADPNLPHGKKHLTPLQFIFQNIINKYASRNDLREKIPMVELLLRAGADPNAMLEGSTPLHLICQHYDHHVELLKKTLPPRICQHHDDDVELLKKIFELGGRRVNVNAQDRQRRTPLFYAVVTLGPSLVDVLLDNGADLSSFTFPTFDDFAENSTTWIGKINYNLILASGVMAIVDSLQKRGYEWYEREENNRTVGKLFARYELFQRLSDSDIRLRKGKCWFEEDAFVEKAKEIKFKADLSLHDVIQLRPKEAKKKLDYLDYFRFATSGDLRKLESYRFSCALHLCEKLARAHFQELALKVFPSFVHIHNLPEHISETIFDHLTNKDLWHIYDASQQQIEMDRQNNPSS
ncbi:uncharacterized protein LOC106654055 [Trichogramma pretiosum]|uniref:uncharacterized protein LOC106654055 n=1 Tax=Trichogramma pretiosum TaxID=7493 RepID=UPI000C719B13|nr:uncharacterized protein LOC106654055 [Trichogramma pretiosum]